MAAETRVPPGLDRAEVERYIAGRPPVELIMARSLVCRAGVVGPVLVVLFGLLKGVDGALGAVIGVAIVIGYYLLTGATLSWLARISLGAYHAGALLGFVVRLGLIAGTMLAVTALFGVDRTSLGLTVVTAYVALLVWEAGALATTKAGKTTEGAKRPRGADRAGDAKGHR